MAERFKAVNDTPIAKVDYKTGKIDFVKKDYAKKDKKATGTVEIECRNDQDYGESTPK